MERQIPHVLDIFSASPGERRRRKERETDKISSQLKEQQKNPGSDSAVSLDSSDEDERNISKYFDYLDDDDEDFEYSNVKKWQPPMTVGRETKTEKFTYDKDIKHIERHLSMKKTIRKKMMRDLQQAFVENPGELQQDPTKLTKEKKKFIDIHNLTISRKRMSKSEHSFLDMLKEHETKDRITGQHNKTRPSGTIQDDFKIQSKFHPRKSSKTNVADEEDSGNDSPTRDKFRNAKKNQEILKTTTTVVPPKEDKKVSFWKRLTGKGNKNK